MAANGNYALRVPTTMTEDLWLASFREGVSVNTFIVQALAEKIAVLRERGMLGGLTPDEQMAYLQKRSARAGRSSLTEILARTGTNGEVRPGDEVPEGWLSPEREDEVAPVAGPRR